jgi:hypothetical protein
MNFYQICSSTSIFTNVRTVISGRGSGPNGMEVSGKRTLATAPGFESSSAAKSLIIAAVNGSIGIWFSPKVLKKLLYNNLT